MPTNCAICQESGIKLKNIYKTSIGSPLIRVKEVLLQVFEEEDKLPNDIGKFGENQSSLCTDCEIKLLEYYEATLRVAAKRKEFRDLVRPLDIKSSVQEMSISSPIPRSDHGDNISESTMDDADDVDWVMDVKDIKLLRDDDSDEALDSPAHMKTYPFKSNVCYVKQDHGDGQQRTLFKRLCCPECKEEFPTERSCRQHVKEMHKKSGKYKCQYNADGQQNTFFERLCCPVCNEEFPTERSCRQHVKEMHKKSGIYKCSSCELSFRKMYLLSVHETKHLALSCSYCSLSFSRKRDLRLHKETQHSDIKEFQCDACGNLYNTRRSLIKHKRSHSGINKYACDECPKSFRESQDFNRHKLTHSGLKPHACPVCFRKFARIHNMYSHMKEHSKPGNLTKRPECNSCGQFFTAQQFLNNHLEAGKCVMAYTKIPQHKKKQ